MRPLVAVLAALAGCAPPIDDDRCFEDRCGPGQVCTAGRCAAGEAPDGGAADQGMAPAAGAGWTLRTAPCVEGSASTLLVVGEAVYAGCGPFYAGLGLYRSDDLAASWVEVPGFEQRRVTDLDPAPDGGIYVTAGGNELFDMVRRLAPDGSVTPVYTASEQTTRSLMQRFARLDSGVSMVTGGAELVHRSDDGVPFAAYDLRVGEGGFKASDLVTAGGQIFGVGAGETAPRVLLPGGDGQRAVPFFEPVSPLPAVRGVLIRAAVDGGRLLAVGYEERPAPRGIAVLGPTDTLSAGAWRALDLSSGLAGESLFLGACMRGQHLLVLGQHADAGLVVESTDGGETWADVTPTAPAAAWESCAFLPDGRILVGGEGGVALRAPSLDADFRAD